MVSHRLLLLFRLLLLPLQLSPSPRPSQRLRDQEQPETALGSPHTCRRAAAGRDRATGGVGSASRRLRPAGRRIRRMADAGRPTAGACDRRRRAPRGRRRPLARSPTRTGMLTITSELGAASSMFLRSTVPTRTKVFPPEQAISPGNPTSSSGRRTIADAIVPTRPKWQYFLVSVAYEPGTAARRAAADESRCCPIPVLEFGVLLTVTDWPFRPGDRGARQ